ncbi:xylulokinase [Salmonella enterica subsp. enterica serovar Choleraesuis]|nr:xylulokinase [Salmonella enterica subsp. enterica serovar Choleraesuis]
MYLGIDLGTSGVKALVLDEDGAVVATHSAPLSVNRPHPLWSEQDPEAWWQATERAIAGLRANCSLAGVKAIGLSGQMHGATLLDDRQQVLRPAILWNDGRSAAQCIELERRVPDSRQITGNLMMPGFTAPKLLWLAENEPEVFSRISTVLLPKDYLRLRLCGECVSDMSDAAGTLWLDVGQRRWSEALLDATGLTERQMPALCEGNAITGQLRPELAAAWGMDTVPVVGGGGDNAAGAIGVGLWRTGQAMLSLGTSGVYFAVSDGFRSNTQHAVHSFCHALPDTWHLMSVMLSAASCLDWVAQLTGAASVAQLLDEAERETPARTPVVFLPYLSGERTPHNDANACGMFWGLHHDHRRSDLARAVLEGVGFGLADGMDALHATGLRPDSVTLIGGGARSAYWRQMLADITGMPLDYRQGGEVGPALGAARLARLAMHPGADFEALLPMPEREQLHPCDRARHEAYQERRDAFRSLYQRVNSLHPVG